MAMGSTSEWPRPATVTLTGASRVASPPPRAGPSASKWCWPAAASPGTSTETENRPVASVITDATTIGADRKVMLTVAPGAKPLPERVSWSPTCTLRAVTPRTAVGGGVVVVGPDDTGGPVAVDPDGGATDDAGGPPEVVVGAVVVVEGAVVAVLAGRVVRVQVSPRMPEVPSPPKSTRVPAGPTARAARERAGGAPEAGVATHRSPSQVQRSSRGPPEPGSPPNRTVPRLSPRAAAAASARGAGRLKGSVAPSRAHSRPTCRRAPANRCGRRR